MATAGMIAAYLRGKSPAEIRGLLVETLRNLSEAQLKAVSDALIAEVNRRTGLAIGVR